MVSDEALRFISDIFIGDFSECFSYKKGEQLVEFFNLHFGFDDIYQAGFPSRWAYVVEKLKELEGNGQLNDFFSLILSKRFLMRDNKVNEIEAIEKGGVALELFNDQLQYDGYQLLRKGDKYLLIKEDEDIQEIGQGGFAIVYYRKSDNRVIKKLKDDCIRDPGIRSRFKREFEITDSLQDIEGIIKLFGFEESKSCYEMEKGDLTLTRYVTESHISLDEKIELTLQLLKIISKVHERNVIHRDLSPSNILFVNGEMKVTDFGLGKNFEVVHSHQTLFTNNYGQFYYCSPEQMNALRDGDKRSDVYSLGKIINYIFTQNPNNERHELNQVVNKATSQSSENRYNSASDMLRAVESLVQIMKNQNLREIAKESIKKGDLTQEVIQYINSLNADELCVELVGNPYFKIILVEYMKLNEHNERYVIDAVEDNFQKSCPTFQSNDPVASFAFSVIQDDFTYVTKEKSAKILNHIAFSVNRFSSQRMIDNLIDRGIDPLLEEILQR